VLAGGLYAWNLTSAGYANEYYAAAVLSMTQSLHNFFFFSLDPGGFITPDKPPFAYWVQAIAARIFGFSSLSILAPQAIAGVATVLVVHHLVRRVWGEVAGLIAALVVTLTPITVAVNRDNLPDPILVLLLVLGAWGLLNAIRTPRRRPLLVGALMVGLAFNTKMLQAYLVVPAGALVYLLAAPVSLRRRIAHLVAAGAVLAVVSAAWMVVVDAVPADSRPYIGGSTDNTVLNLVLGYNGLGRIFGNRGPGGGVPSSLGSVLDALGGGSGSGAVSGGQGPGGGPGGGFGGQAGWLRLFNSQVGTQISWLLLASAIGLAAGVAARLGRPRTDEARANLLFWGGWLGTHFVVFSLASGIFHPYYTTAMGPAIGALMGAGLVTMWRWYRQGGIRVLPLPLALVAGASWAYVLFTRTTWGQPWLSTTLVALTAVAAGGLLLSAAVRVTLTCVSAVATVALPATAFALGLAALLLGPGVWSVTTVQAATVQAVNPLAGPAGVGGGFGGRGAFQPPTGDGQPPQLGAAPQQDGAAPSGQDGASGAAPGESALQANGGTMPPGAGELGGPGRQVSPQLLAYLLANQGDAKFLVAVNGANSAAPIILATGKPVVAMGGFIGSDPAPTVAQLQQMVASGELRFVLAEGGAGPAGGNDAVAPVDTGNARRGAAEGAGGRFGPGDSSGRMAWVTANCAPVDAAAYGGQGGQQLYDCALATAGTQG
jgi:4-amino-4-deoxy-L-arabinose transferase-like glycosyltransferase